MYNYGMPFNNQFYNPTMNNQRIQSQQQYSPISQQSPMQQEQYMQQQSMYRQSIPLQGKLVDSIELVKATEIPLDGSISYFPLTDGTAIITKQLQMDGTSKTLIYKPVENNDENKKEEEKPKYVTIEEFEQRFKKINNSEIKDELKTLKRQIKDITEDIKEINKDIQSKEE